MANDWEAELPALAALTDQEAADAINAMTTRPFKPEAWVSFRTFSVVPGLGLLAGQRLTDKLRAILATDEPTGDSDAEVLARAFRRNIEYMADPKSAGIDVSREEVHAGLQLAVGFGGVTAEEVAAILDFGLDTARAKYATIEASAVGVARGTRPLVQRGE